MGAIHVHEFVSLDDIAALLDDPGVDRLAHLRRQERLLRDRSGRLEEMVAAVHLMIEAEHMDLELTPEERFELFGDFDFDGYAPVAKERSEVVDGLSVHAKTARNGQELVLRPHWRRPHRAPDARPGHPCTDGDLRWATPMRSHTARQVVRRRASS